MRRLLSDERNKKKNWLCLMEITEHQMYNLRTTTVKYYYPLVPIESVPRHYIICRFRFFTDNQQFGLENKIIIKRRYIYNIIYKTQ